MSRYFEKTITNEATVIGVVIGSRGTYLNLNS